MGGAVDLFQFGDRDLGINLRRFQGSMTQHHLDVTDVRPVFQHRRCHTVTEQMATATLAEVSASHVVPNNAADLITR